MSAQAQATADQAIAKRPLLVKVCGLGTREAVESAIACGADLVGFVFFPPSPRHLDPARARELAAGVEGRARTVALTVDASDHDLDAIVRAVSPDLIQLHGQEGPDRVQAIRARFGRPLVKVVAIAEARDLARAAAFEKAADYLLLDAVAPASATRPGGNGQPFDWTLLAGFRPRIPWLLSGGLTSANVARAIALSRPDGVDVSSGVEAAPGRKDPDLIRRFLESARSAAGDA